MFSTLETEDRLTVRGDTAIVAPRSSPDLTSAHRLGLSLAHYVLPRSLQSITRASLDQIDQLLPSTEADLTDLTDLTDLADLTDHRQKGLRASTLALGVMYEPACTRVERREVHRLPGHGVRDDLPIAGSFR